MIFCLLNKKILILKNYPGGNFLKILILLLTLFTFNQKTNAQIVYEPLTNDVYSFLSRLSQKGILEFSDQIKPLPRKYILEKLNEAELSINKLTNLEKEELNYFKQDYYLEKSLNSSHLKKNITLLNRDPNGRLRLFSYSDNLFKINVSPNFGFQIGARNDETISHFWSGLSFYGYLTDQIGFSFGYRDNHESGKTVDAEKKFTPETGIIPISKKENSIDYSEIYTSISFNWSWGNFTAGKDFLEWGYGESGKLVLSNKAPSFPFIRLDIYPVDWLRFNYIHAWLLSDVIDSSSTYSTFIPEFKRIEFRKKFFASHTITITPLKGLDISLGESIIYPDRLEISYLMPLMFFRLADHYLSKQNNNAGGNSQFFLGVSSRDHLKNTHLYGTLFIDEITFDNLFNSQKQRNQLGFSLGSSVVDFPINNLTFTTEYTKIFPFTYSHFIPTETYENSSYVLGHWMGNNADLIYASINYRFSREFQMKIWTQYIRKGEAGTAEQQWNTEKPQPPFLFGLRNNYTYFGLNLKFEILHEFFAEGKFQTNTTKTEISKNIFTKKTLNEFYLSIYYGF